jgi:hypothetical protein
MQALQCHPMRSAVYVVPLIAGLFGGAGIAAAQEPTSDQQSAIRSNCRSDIMANCSGVPRGGKEAMQCLKDNVAKLSSGCQQAVKAVMPAPAAKPPAPVTAAPAAPATTASPPAPAPAAPVAATPPAPPPAAAPAPAAAKRVAPVASTPPAVPAQPAAVKPAPAAKSAANPPASAPPPAAAPPAVIVVAPVRIFALVRTSCRAEYRAYCSDVDIGGGRVVACLQANAASLSPTCQSGLAELGR